MPQLLGRWRGISRAGRGKQKRKVRVRGPRYGKGPPPRPVSGPPLLAGGAGVRRWLRSGRKEASREAKGNGCSLGAAELKRPPRPGPEVGGKGGGDGGDRKCVGPARSASSPTRRQRHPAAPVEAAASAAASRAGAAGRQGARGLSAPPARTPRNPGLAIAGRGGARALGPGPGSDPRKRRQGESQMAVKYRPPSCCSSALGAGKGPGCRKQQAPVQGASRLCKVCSEMHRGTPGLHPQGPKAHFIPTTGGPRTENRTLEGTDWCNQEGGGGWVWVWGKEVSSF